MRQTSNFICLPSTVCLKSAPPACRAVRTCSVALQLEPSGGDLVVFGLHNKVQASLWLEEADSKRCRMLTQTCSSCTQELRGSPLSRWQAAGMRRANRLATICMSHSAVPPARGLYDPAEDKDACGVGFVGELNRIPTRKCVEDALEMLCRMAHRGACGCDEKTGRQCGSWFCWLSVCC